MNWKELQSLAEEAIATLPAETDDGITQASAVGELMLWWSGRTWRTLHSATRSDVIARLRNAQNFCFVMNHSTRSKELAELFPIAAETDQDRLLVWAWATNDLFNSVRLLGAKPTG